MSKLMRTLLLTGAVAAAAVIAAPNTSNADDYWDGYWGWYDNDYRTYHYRQHRPYRYDYDYDYYDYDYRPRQRRSYRYDPYYYGGHSTNRRHNSLQLGPVHIDWR